MTDPTAPSASNGHTAPERLGDDLARALDAQDQVVGALDKADPTPKDVGPSTQGDVSSEKAATMAKAKSPTPRRARPAAAATRPAPAAAARAANLKAEDSVLIAGIDRAEAEAERLSAWAAIRRQEARDAIRTNPLGSSVVVFAAGMIFGLLLARR